MAAKELMFNTDARAKLKRGVDALAEVRTHRVGSVTEQHGAAMEPCAMHCVPISRAGKPAWNLGLVETFGSFRPDIRNLFAPLIRVCRIPVQG